MTVTDMQHESSAVGLFHMNIFHVTDSALGTESNAHTIYTDCWTPVNQYLSFYTKQCRMPYVKITSILLSACFCDLVTATKLLVRSSLRYVYELFMKCRQVSVSFVVIKSVAVILLLKGLNVFCLCILTFLQDWVVFGTGNIQIVLFDISDFHKNG